MRIWAFIRGFIYDLRAGYQWGKRMGEAEDEYEEAKELAEAFGPWQIQNDHRLPHSATLEEIASAFAEGYDETEAAEEGAMVGFETFLKGEPTSHAEPSVTRPGKGWGKRGW